ncbi:MAG: DPP IV N-terminal domain-containing protein, partial [Pseudomonadota bacterium]
MLVDSKRLEPDDFVLSEEEKALRERKRIASRRGIFQYQWDLQGKALLVPLAGDLFMFTLADQSIRQLTETDAFEYDARISPQGRYVSFLRDGGLYTIDLQNGRERRVSPKPQEGISYGTAEFVAQEEMRRFTGYWWSPDDSHIAYTRVDETGVDIISRLDINAGETTLIEQRYPRAGRPNAVVDLFVKKVGRGKSRKIAWGASPDTYLARVYWGQERALYLETVNRDQTERSLRSVRDGATVPREVYTERQSAWINLPNSAPLRSGEQDFKALEDGSLLLTSEESGFRHILRIEPDGDMTEVTKGPWVVLAVKAVDEEKGLVYFTAYKDSTIERHLYRASFLEPAEPERLTKLGRNWNVALDPSAKTFFGQSSSVNVPTQTGIYSIDGSFRGWLEENALDADHPYTPYLAAHSKPEFGTLKTDDGTSLNYTITKPYNFKPGRTYPAILQVYAGPLFQMVLNKFGRSALFTQYWQQQGYVVFSIDSRGSGGRGKAFEDVLYRQLAKTEFADQLLGVSFLKSLPYVDGDRVGVMGWSYGGYMTLHFALRTEPGTFAAAVSGAPVTDWLLYDTFYTERYLDTPEDNPEGYELSSVLTYADELTTPLLVIHGMADDNVIFENATQLFAKFQASDVPFEMMTYPGRRHAIHSGPQGRHRMAATTRFFERYLRPER